MRSLDEVKSFFHLYIKPKITMPQWALKSVQGMTPSVLRPLK